MILVTGATGNVGKELVSFLLADGHALRVVTRDATKVAHLDARVERIVGDLRDPQVADDAMRGAERTFLVIAACTDDLLAAAKRAGVGRFVFLSSIAPESSAIGRMHRERERAIERSGVPRTFIRPGAFMSNAFQWADSIQRERKVYSATGDGKMAPISPRDIALVAARTLTEDGHDGRTYEVAGPELLSTPEQVRLLSKALGESIDCVDLSVAQAVERMRSAGGATQMVETLAEIWTGIRAGRSVLRAATPDEITGVPPQRFFDWCVEYRSAFL